MQDKQSRLQAHVDKREQGRNNSINALQIKNAQYTKPDFITVVQT